jgi:hypothetical protein
MVYKKTKKINTLPPTHSSRIKKNVETQSQEFQATQAIYILNDVSAALSNIFSIKIDLKLPEYFGWSIEKIKEEIVRLQRGNADRLWKKLSL